MLQVVSQDLSVIIKSIEIYYDISTIPGINPDNPSIPDALAFRNDALDLIEAALTAEGQAEWLGAEIGRGEVNFGFEVKNFERAEAIVRAAVRDTRFQNIREIRRFEIEDNG